MTVECFNENKPSEATVDQVQSLIDKAILKGKTRSWVLDRVCDLGGFPSSTLRGDDFLLVGLTHFTLEAFDKLKAEIDALEGPPETKPTKEDFDALFAMAAEKGIDKQEVLNWFTYAGCSLILNNYDCSWQLYDEIVLKIDHVPDTEAEATAVNADAEKLMDAALDALFQSPKASPESSSTSETPVAQSISQAPQTATSSSDASAESAPTPTSGEKPDSSESTQVTEPAAPEASKSGKKRSQKASGKAAKEPGAASGEAEVGYTSDPEDFILNAFRERDIRLEVETFNRDLAEQGINAWIEPVLGPSPTFRIHVDGDDEAVRSIVDVAIPDKLRTDLKNACKHWLRALGSITRKMSELVDLEANYQAMKQELLSDMEALNSCYAHGIETVARRYQAQQLKPDGSYRKKNLKTLAGVITFGKTGGLKIDKDELLASILEKPEEEQAIFPLHRSEEVNIYIDELKETGLLESWQDLGLRGITEEPVNEVGSIKIAPRPRASEGT